MKRRIGYTLALSLIGIGLAGPALSENGASQEYSCRYYGEDYKIGAHICRATSLGLRRVNCSMELNNSAWKISSETCDQATKIKSRTTSKAQQYIDQYIRDYASKNK